MGHCFIFLNPDEAKVKHKNLVARLNIKWLIASAGAEDFCLVSHIVSEFSLYCKSKLDLNLLNNFNGISYVICTSGTTGENKIVKVQNYCIYSNVKSIQ